VPKVSVQQKDGSITIAVAGDEPRSYNVSDGQVTVAEKDVERFLAVVDGSKVAGGSSASATKKES
jgi:hypothetical protein